MTVGDPAIHDTVALCSVQHYYSTGEGDYWTGDVEALESTFITKQLTKLVFI